MYNFFHSPPCQNMLIMLENKWLVRRVLCPLNYLAHVADSNLLLDQGQTLAYFGGHFRSTLPIFGLFLKSELITSWNHNT